ncbi:HAMP domain protein [Burkholderia humptydooensis]|uniref:ATP-binding protein n=1 Tax=Burkholderia TaxID=32008 RepID=UPI0005D7AE5F|nr:MULTISPECIES: ATP-binding protein [Burkholderia]AJY38503.1 HAMP domain protein [Burkholderia sp. 2002721687]
MKFRWWIAHLKIRTRLWLAFAFLLLLLVVTNLVTFHQMGALQAARERLVRGAQDSGAKADHFDRVLLAQGGIRLVNENARRAFELFLIQSRDPIDQQQFDTVFAAQKNTTQRITVLYKTFESLLDTPDERAAFKAVLKARWDYVNTRTAVEKRLAAGDRDAAANALHQLVMPKLATYIQSWQSMIELERSQALAAQALEAQRYVIARGLVLSMLGLATMLAGIAMYSIIRHITSSLRRIGDSAQQYALGNFNQPIEIDADDEIAELAESFNTMAEELEASRNELLNHQRHLEERVAERTNELTAANRELVSTNAKLTLAHVKLLESEKLASIGLLAAGVAHEINNPVGFVYSNFGTLEAYLRKLFHVLTLYENMEEKIASPEAVSTIHSAKETAELNYLKEDIPALMRESRDGLMRVKEIVQNLRDFARNDAKPTFVLANVHQGLDSTLRVVQNEVKAHAEIVKEYGDLPDIECVLSQLNQVFLNIIVNASHAMRDRFGRITIRTSADADTICIAISDNGCGIASEHLTRIFEPFFTTKPVGKGTGLGLSISYGIVSSHHGQLTVESEPGRGTTFHIVLPIRQPA